jgi:hypothetical protein
MASIPSTDGINTKFYLASSGTYSAVSQIETAILGGEQIENITAFGNIDFGTWAVNTLSTFGGGFKKSIGGQSAGNTTLTVVFDAANATGQADIKLAHSTAGATAGYRDLILMLDDEPSSGLSPHPTYIVCKIKVVALSMPVTMDTSVVYETTVEFMELPTLWKAAGTTV